MNMNRISTQIHEQLMIYNQYLWTIKDFYTEPIIFNQILSKILVIFIIMFCIACMFFCILWAARANLVMLFYLLSWATDFNLAAARVGARRRWGPPTTAQPRSLSPDDAPLQGANEERSGSKCVAHDIAVNERRWTCVAHDMAVNDFEIKSKWSSVLLWKGVWDRFGTILWHTQWFLYEL
jgi:hypothetical protein